MQIGFIITTFLRDELLYKSVQSLIDNDTTNCIIIIVDQGKSSIEKNEWLKTLPTYVYYYPVSFNSGLSYCRNFGVKKAKELGCDYIMPGADSFLFDKSIQKLSKIIDYLKKSTHSFCGFEWTNSICGWEAKLNLIEGQSFELDFVDKNKPNFINNLILFWNVDICRNVFIAKTEMLLKIKWDENLLLGEHEDFFWRVKKEGYTGVWTNYIIVGKMTDRPLEYKRFRDENFRNGKRKLRRKYNIKDWVSYQHLERAKT